ncbi:hypothetical protein TNCV_2814781 [Trichonephila clavipes]|nr:hypothetical protein TNCV_2814781 [Trichonephila clavipes]
MLEHNTLLHSPPIQRENTPGGGPGILQTSVSLYLQKHTLDSFEQPSRRKTKTLIAVEAFSSHFGIVTAIYRHRIKNDWVASRRNKKRLSKNSFSLPAVLDVPSSVSNDPGQTRFKRKETRSKHFFEGSSTSD